MEIDFRNADLERLYTEANYNAGYDRAIVRAFRKCMQVIVDATNENDLYALTGLRFKKLKGARSHQRSIRLNDQFRLIVEIKDEKTVKVMLILGIEDYH